MKIKSLGLKVSLIVAIMLAITIAAIIYIVSSQSNVLVQQLASHEAKAANSTFAQELQNLQNDAKTRADLITFSPDIINSILNEDEELLRNTLYNYREDMDVITLCDADGNVLMRTHNDQKGDNVMSQKALSVALKTGMGVATIEKGSVIGISTRGSSAITDYNGNIIGAVTCGHDLSKEKYVDLIKLISNSEVTIFDGYTRLSTTLMDEQGNRSIGTKASDVVVEQVLSQRNPYELEINLFGHEYYAYYSPLIVDDEVIGMLFSGVNIDETLAQEKSMMNMVLLTGIVCGVLAILLVFIFNIISVSRPLKKTGAFAERIKNGDLGISTASSASIGIRSSDEVGVMAKTLEQAYSQLQGYVGEIKDRMSGLADGDLASESTFEFHGDFVLIKDSINDIIHKLNHIMTEVNVSSSQVSTGAKQVADGSQSLAQGSTEQAASIEELSSSIAEIADKTKANTEMAHNAAELADTIKANAEMGSRQMDEMINAVKDINQASQNISKVIKVIDDIAFQTNILALNAAVEAARAGQHGKGFAVVAEEVRNLASKSAEAAKDTGAMIQDSMEKAELGSRIAGDTAASLNEIVSGIKESTRLMTEISRLSDEQSMGISQINIGIDQVANVVQQNSATAEESAAASEEMSSQSDMLQRLISQFKLR